MSLGRAVPGDGRHQRLVVEGEEARDPPARRGQQRRDAAGQVPHEESPPQAGVAGLGHAAAAIGEVRR